MKIKLNLLFSMGIIMLLFTACIKNTDLGQTDDIVVTPTIELDFIFYNLDTENFTEVGINNLIVSDTTNFDFLNDEFTTDNLIKAEYLFKYTNSFPVSFTTEYKFLSEDNELQYELIIPVGAGSVAAPLLLEHTETVEGEEIINLTNAEKVVINVIASSLEDNLEGTLRLQSKTTYYLRIEQ